MPLKVLVTLLRVTNYRHQAVLQSNRNLGWRGDWATTVRLSAFVTARQQLAPQLSPAMLRARCYHLAPVTAHCTPGLLVAIRVPSSVSVGILPCRNFSLNPGLSATFPQSPTKGQTKLATRDPSNKKWADLSAAQKVGRTASTGASLATIIAGVLVTVP